MFSKWMRLALPLAQVVRQRRPTPSSVTQAYLEEQPLLGLAVNGRDEYIEQIERNGIGWRLSWLGGKIAKVGV